MNDTEEFSDSIVLSEVYRVIDIMLNMTHHSECDDVAHDFDLYDKTVIECRLFKKKINWCHLRVGLEGWQYTNGLGGLEFTWKVASWSSLVRKSFSIFLKSH